jgi:hypothetical protein
MEIDLALDNSKVIESPYDAAIQELDLLLGTNCTEVLGNPGFGVNMEQFLWQMTPSPMEVQSYIQRKIIENTYWCNKLNVNIEVNVIKGSLRDIYEVKIGLKAPNTGNLVKEKKYQYR